jgi:hypothetical protein
MSFSTIRRPIMRDINGMMLKVGDKVQVPSIGVCEIQDLIAPDNDAHQGELVRVRTQRGSKTDIRLRLVKAEYTNGAKSTGFKLGDMLARSLVK